MPYKELTVDYLLGRVVWTGAVAWRVLEYRPDTEALRVCYADDDSVRAVWDWRVIRQQIADGAITVD